jgi:hypothetical protein
MSRANSSTSAHITPVLYSTFKARTTCENRSGPVSELQVLKASASIARTIDVDRRRRWTSNQSFHIERIGRESIAPKQNALSAPSDSVVRIQRK